MSCTGRYTNHLYKTRRFLPNGEESIRMHDFCIRCGAKR